MGSYEYRHYPYHRPAELDGEGGRRPVVIVGAGMAGPTLALALAQRGVPSVVLDEDDTVSLGSRSICQAKHSLETWDRFGVASRMVEKGITWEQGELYLHDKPVFRFNLQPEPGHKFPAFVNLQQYYVEEYLFERCLAEPLVEMRFRNKVVGVAPRPAGVTVEVETPDGRYTLDAEWLVACDGVRSTVRHLMELPYPGEVFHDRFLISDIRLLSELPKERRFWFYPPFHPTNSVLLHRQADDVLRVDFQLGPDADPEEEKKPENIDRRLRQMFGPEARWEHEWTSVYTFTCRMMERFVHGRVLFAGDAAHVVSPFGARADQQWPPVGADRPAGLAARYGGYRYRLGARSGTRAGDARRTDRPGGGGLADRSAGHGLHGADLCRLRYAGTGFSGRGIRHPHCRRRAGASALRCAAGDNLSHSSRPIRRRPLAPLRRRRDRRGDRAGDWKRLRRPPWPTPRRVRCAAP